MAEEATIFDLYQPKEVREEKGPSWWESVKEEVIYPAGRGIIQGAKTMAETAAWQEGGDWLQKDVQQAEEKLLTDIPKPKTPIGRGIERGSRISSELLSAGGGLAGARKLGMQILGSTLPAQALEEMGAPEWVQSLAELAGVLGPDVFAKKIQPSQQLIKMAAQGEYTTQKEMVEAARRMGMNENEIAPLVREGWFRNALENVTSRRGQLQRSLEQVKPAVTTRNFDVLAETVSAKKIPNRQQADQATKGLEKIYSNLASGAQDAISKDYNKFLQSNMTGADAMVFWRQINEYFPQWKSLQGLKEPLKKVMASDLRQDFEMANTLAQRFRDISGRLKPNVATDIFSGGKALALVGSLISGNLPYLKGAAVTAGGQKLASLMLENPRFVNLTRKLVSSFNAENPQAIMKTWNSLTSLVAEADPATAREMRKLTKEEIIDLYE